MLKLVNIKECIDHIEDVMELIYKEWGEFFSGSKEDKIKKIRKSIKESNEFPQIYVIKEDNNIVGSFTFKDKDLDNCDLTPWLACVVIDEKYRGKGYGRDLLEFVKLIADEKYPILYLTTKHIGYYEKIGFEYIGDVEHNGTIERLYKRDVSNRRD